MYLLRGFLGYLGILLVLCLFAHGAAQVAARRLLGAPFRWFDGRAAPAARWRRFGVRAFSTAAPPVAAIALVFLAFLWRGEHVATTRVNVGEGSAKAAGLIDGDRILAIDSRTVTTFDEIRTEIRQGWGEKTLTVERDQRRLTLLVTPMNGRIGVMPVLERRALSAGAALGKALKLPLDMAGGYLKSAFTTHSERAQLLGPVAIVKESERQRGEGDFLYMMALLALALSPAALGLHVFDALTLKLFCVTHAWSEGPTIDAPSTRLARLHQTLWVALLGVALLAVLGTVQATDFGDGALLGIFLLSPAYVASILIVGLVASHRFGTAAGLIAGSCSLFIPCGVVALAAWTLVGLRSELSRRQFRVRGLVAAPDSSS